MKIDRLIGILSILLQKDKVTSQELANKFEVSRRTNRYRQHHTIPNKRLKDKHYGNVHNRLWNHG